MSISSLPFAGIPTFAKFPLAELCQLRQLGARCGVVGAPYDMGSTDYPGSRLAPRAIRAASAYFGYTTSDSLSGISDSRRSYYDIERGKQFLTEGGCFDLGDIEITAGNPEQAFSQITNTIGKILNDGVIPIVIGGDHAISSPILAAYPENVPISVLHFDAHLDLWDPNNNSRFDHSCCMWLAARMPHIKQIAQFGIRGINHSKKMATTDLPSKVRFVTAAQMTNLNHALASVQPLIGDVYISVDMDVFDASIAPGAGTPEPGGICYRDFRNVLDNLITKEVRIVGADVVEVNPLTDPSGRCAALASRVVMDLISYICP